MRIIVGIIMPIMGYVFTAPMAHWILTDCKMSSKQFNKLYKVIWIILGVVWNVILFTGKGAGR